VRNSGGGAALLRKLCWELEMGGWMERTKDDGDAKWRVCFLFDMID
jgi:hypothetical protein